MSLYCQSNFLLLYFLMKCFTSTVVLWVLRGNSFSTMLCCCCLIQSVYNHCTTVKSFFFLTENTFLGSREQILVITNTVQHELSFKKLRLNNTSSMIHLIHPGLCWSVCALTIKPTFYKSFKSSVQSTQQEVWTWDIHGYSVYLPCNTLGLFV